MDKMDLKCPKCGTLCSPQDNGIVSRAKTGYQKAQQQLGDLGGKIGGLLGDKGENAGRRIGKIIGNIPVPQNPALLFQGAHVLLETLSGAKCKYVCPNCGYVWEIDDIDNKASVQSKIDDYLAQTKDFLSWSFEDRKYLLVVNKLWWAPNVVKALELSNLPEGISFSDDLPKENTFYVCHPYNHSLYIPFDSFEVDILRDELDEFSRIMEALGAKSISYTDIYEKDVDHTKKRKVSLSGSRLQTLRDNIGNVIGEASAKGSVDYGRDVESKKNVRSEFGHSTSYNLRDKPPYIPEDLYWYAHRPKWQRYCNSRLEGGLSTLTLNIKNKVDEFYSKSEMLKVAAEAKVIDSAMSGSLNLNLDLANKRFQQREVAVEVEFYPMTEWDNK